MRGEKQSLFSSLTAQLGGFASSSESIPKCQASHLLRAIMKNFDSRVYSISDFLEWDQNGLLELNPDFQRRQNHT